MRRDGGKRTIFTRQFNQSFLLIIIPSLKLTAKATEKGFLPQKEIPSSNRQFSGAICQFQGRLSIYIYLWTESSY